MFLVHPVCEYAHIYLFVFFLISVMCIPNLLHFYSLKSLFQVKKYFNYSNEIRLVIIYL